MRHLPAHEEPKSLSDLTIFYPSSLFEVFSIDFAGPFRVTREGNRFLLVPVKHLIGWAIVRPTRRATTEVVLNFMESDVIRLFGAPGIVVSDNVACFLLALFKNT